MIVSNVIDHLPPQEEDIAECPVCLDPLSNQPTTKLKCDHIFHITCIDEWKERSNTCPMCRKAIDITNMASNNYPLFFPYRNMTKCYVAFMVTFSCLASIIQEKKDEISIISYPTVGLAAAIITMYYLKRIIRYGP